MKPHSPSPMHVIGKTAGRLARKLPIVLLAAAACYGLYYLDQVKNRFDENRNPPINVEDRFIADLKKRVEPKDPKVWEQLNYYLLRLHQRRFASGSDLIATVDNELAADRNEEIKKAIYPAELRFRQCVSLVLKNIAEVDTPPKNAPETRSAAPRAARSRRAAASDAKANTAQTTTAQTNNGEAISASVSKPPDAATGEAFNNCSEQYGEVVKARIASVMTNSARVYAVFSAGLKEIAAERAKASQQEMNVVEASLQPTLDDKRGLYIIYQILRVACGIVIVFSLIAVIGLMLAAFWTVDSVSTFADKAKVLVGAGGGTTAGAGKLAAMSIAAIGLGTAVVTGAAVTRTSAGPNFDETEYEQEGPGPGVVIRKPTPGTSGSGSGTGGEDTGGTAPPAPIVNLYPQVYTTPTIRVPAVTMVPDPNTSTQVQNYFRELERLTKLSTDQLSKLSSPRTDIAVANQKKSDTSPELQPLKVDLMGLVDPTQQTTVSKEIQSIKSSIESLNQLSARLENLYKPLTPRRQNLVSRIFGGNNRYLISTRSLDELKRLMPLPPSPPGGSSTTATTTATDPRRENNQKIVNTLTALAKQQTLPLSEDKFVEQLKLLGEKEWDAAVQAQFREWKATILAYTRVF